MVEEREKKSVRLLLGKKLVPLALAERDNCQTEQSVLCALPPFPPPIFPPPAPPPRFLSN